MEDLARRKLLCAILKDNGEINIKVYPDSGPKLIASLTTKSLNAAEEFIFGHIFLGNSNIFWD